MHVRRAFLFASCLSALALAAAAATNGRSPVPETDSIKTSVGELKIAFIGHGTLMFQVGDTVIHVDPWSNLADYGAMPKADIVLVTHEHRDHLDPAAIAAVRKEGTVILLTEKCAAQVPEGIVTRNGQERTAKGLKIEAVPAYNIAHKRPSGEPFHPRREGNGYVITFGDTRVYVAGDTENIPELKNLKDIAIAFLPVNLPYTMTPEMAADAARTIRPKILYPYHFGDTDTAALVRLLAPEQSIEVRIRNMK